MLLGASGLIGKLKGGHGEGRAAAGASMGEEDRM